MANPAPNIPPRQPASWVVECPSKLKYFHPQLSSMELIRQVMLPHIEQNGSFLVRISTSREKTYTVSVVHNHGIKHFKILKKFNEYYLQDEHFPTIDSLVIYYGSNEVPNLEGISGVRLLFPIINDQADRFTHNMGRRSSSSSSTASMGARGSFSSSARGSVSSMGSSQEEDEYNKIFPRSSSLRQLPPPPGSRNDVTAGSTRRRADSDRDWQASSSSASMSRVRGGRVRSDNMDQRPPAPLPEEPVTGQNGIYNGIYYSCVKNVERNKLPELMQALDMSGGGEEETMCECGLDLELSQLPLGWSVHVSRESDAGFGRPFFMSPDQLTLWNLPKEVYLELNRHQQKFIKYLCDNYKAGNPPPDANTQMEWSSTSSSGSLKDVIASTAAAMHRGAAGSGRRDSTASNTSTGAAGSSGLTSRGLSDPSGATGGYALDTD